MADGEGWDAYDIVEQLSRLANNLGWHAVTVSSSHDQVTMIIREDGRPQNIHDDVIVSRKPVDHG